MTDGYNSTYTWFMLRIHILLYECYKKEKDTYIHVQTSTYIYVCNYVYMLKNVRLGVAKFFFGNWRIRVEMGNKWVLDKCTGRSWVIGEVGSADRNKVQTWGIRVLFKKFSISTKKQFVTLHGRLQRMYYSYCNYRWKIIIYFHSVVRDIKRCTDIVHTRKSTVLEFIAV